MSRRSVLRGTTPIAVTAVRGAVLICCGWAVALHAQPVGTPVLIGGQPNPPSQTGQPVPAAAAPATDPRNGFGEMLKPTAPSVQGATTAPTRGAASTAVISNRPYEPIRRVDDEGQIPEIEMFVGESRVFPTPGVARIAVGNGAILTAAALDNKEVILFANQVGVSSLFIWNADGRYQRVKISIVPGDTNRNAREIAAFLSSIPRAKASIVGANIIVEGDELSDADLSKIEDLAKRYPQIVNFTNKVGWEQMVLMDVKVVEFPISYLRDVGLKWTPTGGAAVGAVWGPFSRTDGGAYQVNLQTSGTTNAPPISGQNNAPLVIPSGLNVLSLVNLGLNAQLALLEQQGKSQTLAEPQLSARNGSKASFTAGGELPYAVQTKDGISVAYKEYGVKLDITPKVDRNGVIRAVIHAEVSSVDASITTAAGPALLTRKTDTEFNLRAGETMVLAGLLQRDLNGTVDKVPLLGDIPILGALFRSKHYQNKETEMVVFVTPTLVSANSAGNRDRIERTTERLQERFGPAPYLSEPLQPGVSNEQPNAIPLRPPTPIDAAASTVAVAPAAITPMPAAVPVAIGASSAAPGANGVPAEGRGSNLNVTGDATLRSQPGADGAALLQLERGATVQLGAASARIVGGQAWRNVTLGGLDGWVPAAAVTPTRLAADATVAGIPASGRPLRRPLTKVERSQRKPLTLDGPMPQASAFKVMKQGIAIRIVPDMNAEIVAQPPAGALLLALPYPTRGGWTAVQLGDGDTAQRGWIASQWLKPVTP